MKSKKQKNLKFKKSEKKKRNKFEFLLKLIFFLFCFNFDFLINHSNKWHFTLSKVKSPESSTTTTNDFFEKIA